MKKKGRKQAGAKRKNGQQAGTKRKNRQQAGAKRNRKQKKPKQNASNKSAINFILKMEHLRKILIPESVLTEYCIGRILVKERRYSNLFVFGAVDSHKDSEIS